MTVIDPSPSAIKNMLVQVGTDSYEKAVSSCKFNPTAPSAVEFRGGTPDAVYKDQGASTYDAAITAVQDWEDEDSFVNFCFDHAGEEAVIIFKPNADGNFGVTTTITIPSPEIGGDVGAFPTTTLTAPCKTKPERIAVTP